MIILIIFMIFLYLLLNEIIPSLIFPFELIAHSEQLVNRIINNERKITTIEWNISTCPNIHGIRKKSIALQVLSRHGINTPLTHPSFFLGLISLFSSLWYNSMNDWIFKCNKSYYCKINKIKYKWYNFLKLSIVFI